MKSILRLFIIVMFFVIFSCSTEDNLTPAHVSNGEIPDLVVAATAGLNPLFSKEGGTATVSFTANDVWTAGIANERADSWISVSPTSGSTGSGTIAIVVKPIVHRMS